MTRTALVTGGAGFIGSHCCRDLLDSGFDVVVIDNLINSHEVVMDRIRQLGGGNLSFHTADVSDTAELESIFTAHPIDVVIHFAAHKAVGDSMQRPIDYYQNNVSGLISLITVAHAAGIRDLVFSSSCSIYGDTDLRPITEESPARPTNPYARSKWMCELILEDLCNRYDDWSVTALRYFNPAGAHPSGVLGEDPLGVPSNIFPFLAQVATGRLSEVKILGSDYPTADGTAVRDYIHVLDVVEGHRLALEERRRPGFRRYNLGTGTGTSVLELVKEFELQSGRRIPYRFVDRRPGDVAELVASPVLAEEELGWRAKRPLSDMCADMWRFQEKNPHGYGEKL
ncbi:UDP-glucose 4-epimerase GalE [Arthrobacter sp. Sr33]